jgi:hypothetical protein
MRFRTTDRDVGLRRVSSLTRWVVGGAVALVGLLSAMVSQALPGASGTTTSSQQPATAASPAAAPTSPPTTAAPSSSSSSSSSSDTSLQPAPPPVVTHQRSVARSGGS